MLRSVFFLFVFLFFNVCLSALFSGAARLHRLFYRFRTMFLHDLHSFIGAVWVQLCFKSSFGAVNFDMWCVSGLGYCAPVAAQIEDARCSFFLFDNFLRESCLNVSVGLSVWSSDVAK